MEGFVLKHDAAIDYLKEAAAGFYREAVENGEECGEAIEDCANMAQKITAEGWDWVLFTEHPMAPSQLNVQEMKSEAPADAAGNIVKIAEQRLDSYAGEVMAYAAMHHSSKAAMMEARKRAEQIAEDIQNYIDDMEG